MKYVAIGVLLPAFLTAACDSARTPDPAADRQAIAAATAQFQAAENAGSVDQFRSHFADDLVMMAPNKPPVTGGDSVAALMREFHDAFAVQVEYNSQEIVVFGDWAFDRGTEQYTLTPKAGGLQSGRAATTSTCISVKRMVPGGKAESSGTSSDPLR
jgi:ketosteroid isomerase-like protein